MRTTAAPHMRIPIVLAAAILALSACQKDSFIVRRSLCPAVQVPAFTGDVTRFDPPESREANAVALTASLTDLRGDCVQGSPMIGTRVSFRVLAQRRERDKAAAATVTLPVFVSVVRGGEIVVSKEIVPVTIAFAAGSARASSPGVATVQVARSAAALPDKINKLVTRERKPGEADAATDPLAEPKVRDAVRQATFEVLVGFQLDQSELGYNATK